MCTGKGTVMKGDVQVDDALGTTEIPYSGKFLYGANFRIFHTSVLYTKIKTTKI